MFRLLDKPIGLDILEDVLSRKKEKTDMIGKIIGGLRRLADEESFTHLLFQYQFPLDLIESLYHSRITYQQLLEHPYMYLSKYDAPLDKIDVFALSECDIRDGEYHRERLRCFVLEAMKKSIRMGHSCLSFHSLVRFVNFLFKKDGYYHTQMPPCLVYLCVSELSGVLSIYETHQRPFVYFNTVWEDETKIIRNLVRLSQNIKQYQYSVDITAIEQQLGITYTQKQRNAFRLLGTSGIKILTGPPGSGKTALINGLMEMFQHQQSGCGTIRLAATTGMASKVMSAACNSKSQTLNKLLDVVPYSDRIEGKNHNNPIDADFIIVDEISMAGAQLFSILTDAVKNQSILLLVGDEDQLQSVEYGNILHDLIASGFVEVYRLNEILRQSGTIVQNAKKIQEGKHALICDKTFQIIPEEKGKLSSLLLSYLNEDPMKTKILCPVKKGEISTFTINQYLQNALMKKTGHCKPLTSYGHNNFYLADHVIMTKTNYEKGYTNGDQGIVVGYHHECLLVQFHSGVTLPLDRQDLHFTELAYATTIHKAQGTEADHILVVLPQGIDYMMSRRLLYTAVTRARKSVCIYSAPDVLQTAINNVGEHVRTSLLLTRLLDVKRTGNGKLIQ